MWSRAGRCARVQGKAGSETEYGSGAGSGADLAARRRGSGFTWWTSTPPSGRGSNRELLAEVVAALEVKVEMSGGSATTSRCGPRWPPDAPGEHRHRRPGESRVVRRAIGEYGDKVAVGLDVQIVDGEHRLRGRGWETDGGDLWHVLERLDSEGCSRFVVTDVTKDGTLTGPNLDLLEGVAECTEAPVIASVACPASTTCGPSPP